MAEYPEIARGMGVLSPELWHRLMVALRFEEETITSDTKSPSPNTSADQRRRKIPNNLVRVKNDNATVSITRGEACCVTGTILETNLAECLACTLIPPLGSCEYGTCGSWPSAYGEIETVAFNELMTFNVRTVRTTPKEFVPVPGNLQRWFIAADSISAGQTGWAYSSGLHWAWIWDPVGLLEIGSGAYLQSETLFVDLPDPTFEDGEEDDNLFQYAAYDPDNQWQATGTPRKVYSPLMVRPQGSARILYADTTDTLFAASVTGGGPGDGNTKWPISAADAAGSGMPAGMDAKIRLALIERCGWTVPCIPAQITDGTKRTIDAVEQDYLYEYDWYHLTGLTGYEIGSGGTRRAYNLAEINNCVCTTAACEECCAEQDLLCKRVAGFPIPKLVNCFGSCGWRMQPIGGWGCIPATSNGQSVSMNLTIDNTGLQRPTFALQNPITSICTL